MDGSPPNLGLEAQTAEIGGEVVGTTLGNDRKRSQLFFHLSLSIYWMSKWATIQLC